MIDLLDGRARTGSSSHLSEAWTTLAFQFQHHEGQLAGKPRDLICNKMRQEQDCWMSRSLFAPKSQTNIFGGKYLFGVGAQLKLDFR